MSRVALVAILLLILLTQFKYLEARQYNIEYLLELIENQDEEGIK